MPTNQTNIDKHRQERWENFLDTVFARSKKIKEIQMSGADIKDLELHMHTAGYQGLLFGLNESPPRLWGVPIAVIVSPAEVVSYTPKIVYHEGVMSPEPNPKIKKEKVVNTWLDDEV